MVSSNGSSSSPAFVQRDREEFAPIVEIAGRRVNLVKNTCTYRGQTCSMSNQCVEVLELLLEKAPDFCPRREFIDRIWGGNELVGKHGLSDRIYTLRKCLYENDDEPLIKTLPRRGYQLHPSVVVTRQRALVEDGAFQFEAGRELIHRPGWVLQRKLRAGGFGEVWLVENEQTGEQRTFELSTDPVRAQRLRSKVPLLRRLGRQINAIKDIASIIEWNFDEVPFYIESQYPPGLVLSEVCNAPSETDFWARMRIIEQVAAIIASAHQAGAIHGSLHLSNIILRAKARGGYEPILVDFGIAKLVREAYQLTGDDRSTPEIAGTDTLAFLAPECLAGKPATRHADVYGLGVILYQLFGRNHRGTFGSGWERDIDDKVLRDDIRHAIDREPERRPTASQLAHGLMSHADRLREYERTRQRQARDRRRRYLIRALIGLTPLFIVLLVLFAYQYHRAEHHRKIAENSVEFLVGVMESIDPINAQSGAVDMNAILDRSARQVEHRFSGHPEFQYRLLQQLSRVKFSIGLPGDAQELSQAALRYAEASGAGALDLARIHNAIAGAAVRQEIRDPDRSLSLARPAIELLESAGLQETPEYFWALINMGGLGCRRLGPSSPDCFEPLYMAKEVAEQLADPKLIAASAHSLASRLEVIHPDDAVEGFEGALDRAISAFGPDHEMTNHIRAHLANAYRRTARYDVAEATFEAIVESQRRIYGEVSPISIRSEVSAIVSSGMGGAPDATYRLMDLLEEPARSAYEVFEISTGLALLHAHLGACDQFEAWMAQIEYEPLLQRPVENSVIWKLQDMKTELYSGPCPSTNAVLLRAIIDTGLEENAHVQRASRELNESSKGR